MGTDIHLAAEVFKDGRWQYAPCDLPDYRNYRAFAILADVRNGYTFAGFDSGDPVIPISEPRGLPQDLSQEIRAMLEDTDSGDSWTDDEDFFTLGDHSFSWVTLKELLDVDLEAPVTLRGMVPPQEAQRWKETGKPPAIVAAHVSHADWVRLEWQRPLRESAGLIGELIEALTPLGDPQHVRLVFGFDN